MSWSWLLLHTIETESIDQKCFLRNILFFSFCGAGLLSGLTIRYACRPFHKCKKSYHRDEAQHVIAALSSSPAASAYWIGKGGALAGASPSSSVPDERRLHAGRIISKPLWRINGDIRVSGVVPGGLRLFYARFEGLDRRRGNRNLHIGLCSTRSYLCEGTHKYTPL